MLQFTDRTWVEISRSAIRHNLRSIQRLVGPVPIAPVIKANAYGHGVFEVAEILNQEKIWGVCVAYGSEALHLRHHGWRKRILVLSFWQSWELSELIRQNIDIVVWDERSLRAVTGLSRPLRHRARIHVKVDSGTSRIGFLGGQISRLHTSLQRANIKPVGIFSHLANSEEAGTARTKKQIRRFTTLISEVGLKRGILVHIACTASALRYPEARFDLIRLGIGLYGLWPSEATKSKISRQLALLPAMTWKSRISQIKAVPRNTAIGYGGTWVSQRPARVATIPVGYSDGYKRSWSNAAWVMINGRRAPVIGRVSMNLIMVDVSKISSAKWGTTVILLGPGVSAEQLAHLQPSTINYEVTTSINPLITRYIV